MKLLETFRTEKEDPGGLHWSRFNLHCTAKTAKSRKLAVKQVQRYAEHAENNTRRELLQTLRKPMYFLPSEQNMHLHSRAHNRGSHRNQSLLKFPL